MAGLLRVVVGVGVVEAVGGRDLVRLGDGMALGVGEEAPQASMNAATAAAPATCRKRRRLTCF